MMYEEIYKVYKEVVDRNLSRDLFIQPNTVDKSVINDLIQDVKSNKIIIYTAFTGDYDTLKNPEFIDDNCDYVCFTDNPDLKSDIWEIRLMEESTLDNNRIAKQYKVLPHKYFPDYKYSFWLDGSFKIKSSIREYIYKYIKSNLLHVVHTERDCIYDEVVESNKSPRYSNTLMTKQVDTYRAEGMPEHYGLPVLGAIFREHNDPKISSLMNQWWGEITKFTNQDQLSYSYLAWKNGIHLSVSDIYYWDNEYWGKEDVAYHHKVLIQTPEVSYNLVPKLKEELANFEKKDKTYKRVKKDKKDKTYKRVKEDKKDKTYKRVKEDKKDKNNIINKHMLNENEFKLSKEELYLLINDVIALNGEIKDKDGEIAYKETKLNNLKNSSSLKTANGLKKLKNFKSNSDENKLAEEYIMNSDLSDDYKNIYLKAFRTIKKLALIDELMFYQNNPDAEESDLDPVLFYLFRKDNKLRVFSPYFDCEFYKKTYLNQNKDNTEINDPLIHYAVIGLANGNSINEEDDGFIKDIDKNAYVQYEEGLNRKLAKINNNLFDLDLDDYEDPTTLKSLDLVKSLEGNVQNENIIKKEDLAIVINDIDYLKFKLDEKNQAVFNIENESKALLNSKSWKMTKPLRAFNKISRKLKN